MKTEASQAYRKFVSLFDNQTASFDFELNLIIKHWQELPSEFRNLTFNQQAKTVDYFNYLINQKLAN